MLTVYKKETKGENHENEIRRKVFYVYDLNLLLPMILLIHRHHPPFSFLTFALELKQKLSLIFHPLKKVVFWIAN